MHHVGENFISHFYSQSHDFGFKKVSPGKKKHIVPHDNTTSQLHN